ncbi:MAG: hypothetical protein R6V12_16245 [Candidatus Hydrogenedentota bacterium]
MSYKGHVQNGVIVFDEPAELAEGAPVRIEVLDNSQSEALHPDIEKFTGILPSDIDVRAEYTEDRLKT